MAEVEEAVYLGFCFFWHLLGSSYSFDGRKAMGEKGVAYTFVCGVSSLGPGYKCPGSRGSSWNLFNETLMCVSK